ncbi:MAG: dTDP-4-dehydrorhamnose 3,5-epimerase [Rhizobacter sp.]|nr:dTDP-4-dehydrorhamnose 3,5-epimerase [Chlorobiales bacterium]
MKITPSPLSGLYIIEPKVFGDDRGFFYESYNEKVFAEHGITAKFVQDNVSRSVRGVVRGLHYQLNPHAQAKLVRVLVGEVFDVAVDLREDSPTFGRWFGYMLSSENKHSLYIPEGFAHGFCVTSETAEFTYKVTSLYAPTHERGLLWNDPALAIDWPDCADPALLSAKDKAAQPFAEAEHNFVL